MSDEEPPQGLFVLEGLPLEIPVPLALPAPPAPPAPLAPPAPSALAALAGIQGLPGLHLPSGHPGAPQASHQTPVNDTPPYGCPGCCGVSRKCGSLVWHCLIFPFKACIKTCIKYCPSGPRGGAGSSESSEDNPEPLHKRLRINIRGAVSTCGCGIQKSADKCKNGFRRFGSYVGFTSRDDAGDVELDMVQALEEGPPGTNNVNDTVDGTSDPPEDFSSLESRSPPPLGWMRKPFDPHRENVVRTRGADPPQTSPNRNSAAPRGPSDRASEELRSTSEGPQRRALESEVQRAAIDAQVRANTTFNPALVEALRYGGPPRRLPRSQPDSGASPTSDENTSGHRSLGQRDSSYNTQDGAQEVIDEGRATLNRVEENRGEISRENRSTRSPVPEEAGPSRTSSNRSPPARTRTAFADTRIDASGTTGDDDEQPLLSEKGSDTNVEPEESTSRPNKGKERAEPRSVPNKVKNFADEQRAGSPEIPRTFSNRPIADLQTDSARLLDAARGLAVGDIPKVGPSRQDQTYLSRSHGPIDTGPLSRREQVVPKPWMRHENPRYRHSFSGSPLREVQNQLPPVLTSSRRPEDTRPSQLSARRFSSTIHDLPTGASPSGQNENERQPLRRSKSATGFHQLASYLGQSDGSSRGESEQQPLLQPLTSGFHTPWEEFQRRQRVLDDIGFTDARPHLGHPSHQDQFEYDSLLQPQACSSRHSGYAGPSRPRDAARHQSQIAGQDVHEGLPRPGSPVNRTLSDDQFLQSEGEQPLLLPPTNAGHGTFASRPSATNMLGGTGAPEPSGSGDNSHDNAPHTEVESGAGESLRETGARAPDLHPFTPDALEFMRQADQLEANAPVDAPRAQLNGAGIWASTLAYVQRTSASLSNAGRNFREWVNRHRRGRSARRMR